MFTLDEIIEIAIQIEKNAGEIYRNALRQTRDGAIAGLLRRLADEEEKHIRWFESLRRDSDRMIDNPEFEEMGKSILLGIVGGRGFSLEEADLSSMVETRELFHLAVEFEKDTAIFYEMIHSLVEDEDTLNQLDSIIKEENSHVLLFQELLQPCDPPP